MLHNEDFQEGEGRYIVGSVDSALSILNLFFDHEELSVSEVGKLTGMSRSTAFRFMVTLENRGFVTKTDYGKYRLGLNLFSLGMLAYNSWLKMKTALGYSQYAHCTATGKAILAYQPDHVLTQYLRRTTFVRNTPTSIPDAKALLEILEDVRRKGYACDNEEAEYGLTCYGMPLLDGTGRAYAAISISGPTTRMEAHRDEHLRRLADAVKAISRTIQ